MKKLVIDNAVIYRGDCRKVCESLPEASVSAVVTDPPYGMDFFGSGVDWDRQVPGKDFWQAFLRVAKPGAFLAAFGGTRTYHRIACAVEDAGWELRDCMMWLYAVGYPKSLNLSKAFDAANGVEGKVLRESTYSIGGCTAYNAGRGKRVGKVRITAPESEEAKQWAGWETSLSPCYEPIVLARKPLEGSVIENVRKHGTGGINVGACRITPRAGAADWDPPDRRGPVETSRWPGNVVLDKGAADVLNEREVRGTGNVDPARFFFTAKASKRDRDGKLNEHPSVKPTALMRWLVALLTPPGGTVLDPFLGSGSTGVACRFAGVPFVGAEQDKKYFRIAARRISRGEVEAETAAPAGKRKLDATKADKDRGWLAS
jgi:DNA modification methylase